VNRARSGSQYSEEQKNARNDYGIGPEGGDKPSTEKEGLNGGGGISVSSLH